MMTAGFNKKPNTEIEICFTSICMLISAIVFGYMLNTIGCLLIDLNKQQKAYNKDLNLLNKYMQRKKIDMFTIF